MGCAQRRDAVPGTPDRTRSSESSTTLDKRPMIKLYTVYIVLSTNLVIMVTWLSWGRTILTAKTMKRAFQFVALAIAVLLAIQPALGNLCTSHVLKGHGFIRAAKAQ